MTAVVVGVAASPPPAAPRRRQPASRPFQHQEVARRSGELVPCPTSDADPPWHEIEPAVWQRVCGCHTETHIASSGVLDPSSEGARPSWKAHRHDLACEHQGLPAVVKIERHDAGGWKSECLSCGTLCSYWLDPERWSQQADGSMARVTFRGPCRFVYELAADDV